MSIEFLKRGLYSLFGIKLLYANAEIDGILIFIFFATINYFIFIHGKPYKKAIKIYQNESKGMVRKGNIYVVSYMLLSFLLIAIGFYLMMIKNRHQLD